MQHTTQQAIVNRKTNLTGLALFSSIPSNYNTKTQNSTSDVIFSWEAIPSKFTEPATIKFIKTGAIYNIFEVLATHEITG